MAFHEFGTGKNRSFLQKILVFTASRTGCCCQGSDNLLMAGRCVTEDIQAHMSTRNTVGCMVMGQGAGVAAALCAQADCSTRQLAYQKLKKALLEQSVILEV